MSDFSSTLKVGDIVNVEGYSAFDWSQFFWNVGERLAINAIVAMQKMVFDGKLNSPLVFYKDNHSTLYVGNGKIFSEQPPKATYVNVSDYEKDPRIMTIYRMNPVYFKRVLTTTDLDLLCGGADILVNRQVDYSIPRDVMDGINDLTTFPWSASMDWFDNGQGYTDDVKKETKLVCSAAVASIIQYWREQTQANTGEIIRAPWDTLNPKAWVQSQIDQYPHYWDALACHPGNYATTDTNFSNEFLRIGRYRQGTRIA